MRFFDYKSMKNSKTPQKWKKAHKQLKSILGCEQEVNNRNYLDVLQAA